MYVKALFDPSTVELVRMIPGFESYANCSKKKVPNEGTFFIYKSLKRKSRAFIPVFG